MDQPCILCEDIQTSHIYRDDRNNVTLRDFYECASCGLIFVPPEQHLSPEEEVSRYENHENHPSDPEYRHFLSRLFNPLNKKLEKSSSGLDFGSGPGPTLSVMLEEAGHTVKIFDIFYANDPSVFQYQYDFITSTETVEHLFHPLRELDRLWECLNPGGILGIMTRQTDDVDSFGDWHYKNDDTHVGFYSRQTFTWLRQRWDADVEYHGFDVVLLYKKRV